MSALRNLLSGLALICIGIPAALIVIGWWVCLMALPVLGAAWLWHQL